LGKEDEKKKDKKDKDKSKDKDKDKDKKDKDKSKDKDKKDKDKDKDKKDKDKKDKDKSKDKDKKEKEKKKEPSDWKLNVSSNLDNLIGAYEKIVNKFRDIDNYILKDAGSKSEFIEKVKKAIQDLPEPSQQVFLAFINAI